MVSQADSFIELLDKSICRRLEFSDKDYEICSTIFGLRPRLLYEMSSSCNVKFSSSPSQISLQSPMKNRFQLMSKL